MNAREIKTKTMKNLHENILHMPQSIGKEGGAEMGSKFSRVTSILYNIGIKALKPAKLLHNWRVFCFGENESYTKKLQLWPK